jgi:hypothetical protein
MACPCCRSADVKVLVNGNDITRRVNSLSVDSAPDINREPASNKCVPVGGNNWIYLFGPGKTTIQVTAYPYDDSSGDYRLGLECAVNLSASVPWKYIYNCSLESDCLLKDGKLGKKKGKWVLIPMKKRQVTVTGDLGNSTVFKVDGCSVSAPKFSVQASQLPTYLAQETVQYNHLNYTGTPIAFDTDKVTDPFMISVKSDGGCGGFDEIEAYLTGFTATYTPPQPPTVSYTWECPFSICPGNCP